MCTSLTGSNSPKPPEAMYPNTGTALLIVGVALSAIATLALLGNYHLMNTGFLAKIGPIGGIVMASSGALSIAAALLCLRIKPTSTPPEPVPGQGTFISMTVDGLSLEELAQQVLQQNNAVELHSQNATQRDSDATSPITISGPTPEELDDSNAVNNSRDPSDATSPITISGPTPEELDDSNAVNNPRDPNDPCTFSDVVITVNPFTMQKEGHQIMREKHVMDDASFVTRLKLIEKENKEYNIPREYIARPSYGSLKL